ncbi:ABC transporter ATP-binding protein [Paenibacillus tepidiphilus]|uniref:ABC transporter ATP-binding protein n=1 Tax=Paenibacillus tepidiphilus TaxID=2608683 RepID=UPI00123971BD|nr:ABC transporter ATP-binding protein [Paenibacillus tepidiphilus]
MTMIKRWKGKHALFWSFTFLQKYKFHFAIAILLGMTLSGVNLGSVLFIESAVKRVSENDNNIIPIVLILLGLFVAGTVLTYITEYLNGNIGASVARDMREAFALKFMRISQSGKDRINSGDIVSRFNFDLGIITGFIPGGITNLLYQTIMAFIAMIYMLNVNWFLLLISVAIIPGSMVIVNKLRSKIGDSFGENMENIGRGNTVASETIHNIHVIKAYNLQAKMFENIQTFFKGSLNSWIRIHKLFSPMLMLNIIMKEFPKVLCITVGSYLALHNRLEIESLIAFVLLLDYVVIPITNLPEIITSVSNTNVACGRVVKIFEMPDERDTGLELTADQQNPVLIEMENVHFSYDEGRKVLENVSFRLKLGEKIALVGKSGCGKSSIIKLLGGLYECSKGELYIYGRPYRETTLASIRKHISMVTQDVVIFPASVADNIAFGSGNPELSRDEIITAAKHANAHDFIMRLPEGYDTVMEENGVNLSGGQKQMISIARAFLKASPIILLDESTSALDPHAEAVVTDSLNRLIQGKGAVIVSHRVSSIMNSDRILVMDRGQIVEEGTHEALIAGDSLYKKLYAAGFEDQEDLRLSL